ncbi:MBG domain-containing protein [Niastella sp. OAS944]|uniref:MBG domain-containing protein n=1 Tax=Niastella sp. OAS944 TaxID=2664089 RepID=UPI00346A50CF|nr:hypothetical protein [Chitinophagaceae bacterium OAS944]
MKRIKLSVLAFLLIAGYVSNAQPFYNWAKRMGSGGADVGQSVTVDASGNVYSTGNFTGTVDFDPGAGVQNLVSAGANDVYISKLDAVGRLVWAKSIGGISGDYSKAIAVDASGNVYITGMFWGTADLDPGPGTLNFTSTGFFDTFIIKLDASGNLVWAKILKSSSGIQALSMAVDASGNVFTTGIMNGTVDFDPGPGVYNLTGAGGGDIFVCKLDAAGNFEWAKCMGNTGGDMSFSITVDASGNVYTTGYFQYTVDFDPGPGTQNLSSVDDRDIFISKFDAAGNYVWAKRMGGGAYDAGYSVAVDASGNVYTTGFFQGTADFDPGIGTYNLVSSGNTDIFISKLDAAGNFVWAKRMGGAGHEDGNSLTVDASGNVYITGTFEGTADFDPDAGTLNLVSGGDYDIFISKLNTSGNLVWARNVSGSGNDHGQSISVDATGNVYITGDFQETGDFDPGTGTGDLVSAGDNDIFIAKFSPTANLTIIADAQTKVYGSADPLLTWQVSGFAYGENASSITGHLTRATGENSGTYAIGLGSLTAPAGYTITYGSSDLTITPATLAISANTHTKVYGAADPALAYTATGFVNGDNNNIIAGSLNRVAGENVGVYAINQNTLNAGNNYTITYTGNDLTITPAALAISANAQTKVFGSADPVLTYMATGFANGDNSNIITGNLSRVAGENVGAYVINRNTLYAGNNYTITFTGNSLAITKAPQVITWLQDLTVGCNGQLTLPLTATANSGLSLNYTVANTGIATVSGNVLSLLQSGATVVTAEQPGDANHLPATPVTSNLNYQLVSAVRQHFNDLLLFDNRSGEYVQWQWYKNGAPVAGATTAWYSETAPLNGLYYVLATAKNGAQLQTCPVTCTGSSTVAGGLKIFPNPATRGATTTVTCNYSEATLQGARLLITDNTGVILQQLTSVHPSTQVSLPASAGVYIITLILSNGQKATVNALVN